VKIAVLTNESDMAKYFVSKISENIDIDEMFIENRVNTLKQDKHVVERLFGKTVFNTLKYFKYFVKTDRKLKKIEQKEEEKAKKKYLSDFDEIVGQYNLRSSKIDFDAERDLDRLRSENYDLFILFGTSIIGDAILEIPSRGTINIHTSLLPHYKGTAVEFWQLFNEEYDHCGVTVHYVDSGVDTGNIIVQEPTEALKKDTFFDLRYKNIQKAIEVMPKAVEQVLQGLKGSAQEIIEQKTYTAKMLEDEKKVLFYKRLGLYK